MALKLADLSLDAVERGGGHRIVERHLYLRESGKFLRDGEALYGDVLVNPHVCIRDVEFPPLVEAVVNIRHTGHEQLVYVYVIGEAGRPVFGKVFQSPCPQPFRCRVHIGFRHGYSQENELGPGRDVHVLVREGESLVGVAPEVYLITPVTLFLDLFLDYLEVVPLELPRLDVNPWSVGGKEVFRQR